MFSLFKKKSSDEAEDMQWDDAATQALHQATAQAPVPGIMKQQVKKQLQQAAEEYARNAGKKTVSAEDLMQGLMAKLPENMRRKVEDAAKQGPDGIKKLQDELQ
jgi:histone H3/H4